MKSIQVTEGTHRALWQRKLDQGDASLDGVIARLLGLGGHRARLEAAGPGLSRVCRKHRVARLRVFGSVARGEEGPGSDIDLLVDFEAQARPGLFGLAEFAADLEELLGVRVDATTEGGLHPRLREPILAEAEVVWPA